MMSYKPKKLLALLLAAVLCLNTPMSVLAEGGWVFTSTPISPKLQQDLPNEDPEGEDPDGDPAAPASYAELIAAEDVHTMLQPRYTIAYGAKDTAKETGSWQVLTGDDVTINVVMDVESARRVDTEDGGMEELFSRYRDITLLLKVDSRLTVYTDSAMTTPAEIVKQEGGYSYYSVKVNGSAIATEGTQTVCKGEAYYVRDPQNGLRENGLTYLPTAVEASARVTANDDSGDVILNATSVNHVDLINTSASDWRVSKDAATGTPSVSGDAISFVYHIDVGLPGNTGMGISNEPNIYNSYGALRMDTATVTDKIYAVQNVNGEWVWPTVKSVTMQNGQAASYTLTCSADEPADGAYVLLTMTDQWVTMDSHDKVPGDALRAYTRFAVELTYETAQFMLPYGDTNDFLFTDEAELDYRLVVGEEEHKKTPVLTVPYHVNEAPATVTVLQNLLKINGADVVPYSSSYQSLYGGMSYRIYPKDGDADAAEWKNLGLGGSVIFDSLAKGDYVVEWRTNRENEDLLIVEARTDAETTLGYTQQTEVSLIPGENTDVYFTCQPRLVGILIVKGKRGSEGNLLSGASFTAVKLDEDGNETETTVGFGPTDVNGYTAAKLSLGAWRIKETTVPDGYLAIAEKDILLTAEQSEVTLEGDQLIDYANAAQLTITRHEVEWLGDTATAMEDGETSYTVQGWVAGEDGELAPYGEAVTLTIADGDQETVREALPRYADDQRTHLIHYTVTPVQTALCAMVDGGEPAPQTSVTFAFNDDDNTAHTAAYYYQLLGKITVTKTVKELDLTTYDKQASGKQTGWTVTLTGGMLEEPLTAVTDSNGQAVFADLPMVDAEGERCVYVVTETDGADMDDYIVTYTVDGEDAEEAQVTLQRGHDGAVQVTNTRKRSQIRLVKKDAETGALLAKAEYALFAEIDGEETPVAFTGTDSVYTYADDAEGTLTTMVTNAKGESLITGLPSGVRYVLRETKAPDGYYCSEQPLNAVPGHAAAVTVQAADVKLPELTIRKRILSNSTFACSGNVTFLVGTVDADSEFHPVTNASGKPLEVNVHVSLSEGESAPIRLPDVKGPRTYYVLELRQDLSILAPEIYTMGSPIDVTYNGSSYKAYGAMTCDDSNGVAESGTIEVTDEANEGTIEVKVYDDKVLRAVQEAGGDTQLASLEGRELRLTATIDPSDTALVELMRERGLTVDIETGLCTMTRHTNTIHFVDGSESIFCHFMELPVFGSDGAKITYTVEEVSPENELYFANKQAPVNVTLADRSSFRSYLKFTVEPKGSINIGKYWVDEFHQLTGYPRYEPLNGVSLALYQVVDGKLVYIGVQTTRTLEEAKGRVLFEGVHAQGTYALVEVGRYGEYLLSDVLGGQAELKELSAADGLDGMSDDVLSDYCSVLVDMNQAVPNPVKDTVNAYVSKDSEHPIVNYRPFSQIRMSKLRYASAEDRDPADAVPLNGAKFRMYRVPVSVALQAAVSIGVLRTDADELALYAWMDTLLNADATPAEGKEELLSAFFNAVSGVGADDYVYETAGNGTFTTEPMATYGYVYFLKEVFAPAGIDMNATIGLSGPFYAYVKNGTVAHPDGGNLVVNGTRTGVKAYNVPRSGSGISQIYPVRVELQKVLVNTNLQAEGEEKAYLGLADVRFSLVLTDGVGVLGYDAQTGKVVTYSISDVLDRNVSADAYWHSNITTGLTTTGSQSGYVTEAEAAASPDGLGVSETVYLRYNQSAEGLDRRYSDYLRYYDADGMLLTKTDEGLLNAEGEPAEVAFMEADFLLLEMGSPDDTTAKQSVYPLTLSSANSRLGAVTVDRTYTGTHPYEGTAGYIPNIREDSAMVRLWKQVALAEDRTENWSDVQQEQDIGEYVPAYVSAGKARLLQGNERVTLSIYEANNVNQKPADAEPVFEITLSASEPCTEVLKLERSKTYVVLETVESGSMDVNARNSVGYVFKTYGLANRMHVQEIVLTDNLYRDLTLTKLDVNGQPEDGRTLALQYFDRADTIAVYDNELQDSNGAKIDAAALTTDEHGEIAISLPYFNYKRDKDANQRFAEATYTVAEVTNDQTLKRYFKLINEESLETLPFTFKGNGAQVKVYNPGTTALQVNKKTLVGEESLEALDGVSFALYFQPFETVDEYLGKDAAWPKDMEKKLTGTALRSGTTDDQGVLKLTGLYSGWYRLVETIPETQVGGGKTFEVCFRLIIPEDAALLGSAGSGITLFDVKSGRAVASVTDSKYTASSTRYGKVSDTAAAAAVAHTDADGCTMYLDVTNTSRGYAAVDKTFLDERDGGATPDSLHVKAYKRTKSTFAAEVSAGLVAAAPTAAATTVITDGRTGDSILLQLDPGDYWIAEVLPKSEKWYAAAELNGEAAAMAQKPVLVGSDVLSAVAVTVTQASSAEKPEAIALYNRNTQVTIDLTKMDDAPEARKVDGAQFVLFYLDASGARHYYKGADQSTVLGDWSGKSSKDAKIFTTADGGKLHVSAEICQEMVENWANDAAQQTVTLYLEETKAPMRWYTLADVIEFKSIVPGQTQTSYTNTVVWEEDGTGSVTRIDKVQDATDAVIDRSGLYLDVKLRGRSYENWSQSTDDDRFVAGPVTAEQPSSAVICLYKVDANDTYTLVSRVQTADAVFTEDGEPYLPFSHLDLLKDGERYVLVEENNSDTLMKPWQTGDPDEGYLRMFTYSTADTYAQDHLGMGRELTVFKTGVSGAKYGAEIVAYDDAQAASGTLITVNMFNEPMGKILILKYNYERPDDLTRMALKAEFSAKKSNQEQAVPGYIVFADKHGMLGTVTVDGTEYTYSENGSKCYYTTADGKVYSFHEMLHVVPGDYTLREISAAEDFFYTPEANEHQAWYPVREVSVDTDGGVAVAVFANIPVPHNDDIKLKKTSKVHSLNGGNTLEALQRTFEDGTPQSVTYTIRDFASNNGGKPGEELIVYPVRDGIWLCDGGSDLTVTGGEKTGMTFNTTYYEGTKKAERTGLTAAQTRTAATITMLTIGKAGYRRTTLSPQQPNDGAGLRVDVYGVSADGTVTAAPLTTLKADQAQQVDMTALGEYEGFRLHYYDLKAETRREYDLDAGFWADPVTVTMTLLQESAPDIEPVTRFVNNVGVSMLYDIGLEDMAYAAVTGACTDGVNYNPNQAAASITKLGKKGYTDEDGEWTADQVQLSSDTNGSIVYNVSYRVVFANEDSERVIPKPVVIDVLPKFIRNPADITVRTIGKDGKGTAASLGQAEPIVVFDNIENKFYVYVTYSGETDELRPGEKIELTFDGEVDYGVLASMGDATSKNTAYGSSLKIIEQSILNPFGSPFRSEEANAVSQVLYDEGKPDSIIPNFSRYGTIHTSLDHQKNFVAEINVLKFVSGDLSGMDKYSSGRTSYASASPKGEINYRLQVTCDSGNAENVMLIDQIPYQGDSDLLGRARGSQLCIAGIKANFRAEKKDSTGRVTDITSQVTAEYYAGTGKAAADAVNQREGNGWLPLTGDVTVDRAGYAVRFIVGDMDDGDQVDVYFTCAAPDGVTYDEQGNVTKVNFNQIAYNDVYLVCASGTDHRTITKTSNTATATVLPGMVSLGDTAWLDVNGNGLFDEGEPVFTAGAKGVTESINAPVQLIAYTNQSPVTMLSGLLTDGTYSFDHLETASLKGLGSANNPYTEKNGVLGFTYANLNGNSRKSYQLAIAKNAIPEGYVVTTQYAAGKDSAKLGQPADLNTVAASKFYYYNTERDTVAGRDRDNDFDPLSSGENYITARFYLPMSLREEGMDYPTFDLGLVRVRDLSIVKTGSNRRVVPGATFAIYPAPDGFAGGDVTLTGTPIATMTTDAEGKASFTSSQSSYLNCYTDYLVVETNAPAGYMTAGFTAERTGDSLTTGMAKIGTKTYGYFLLKGDDVNADELEDVADVTVDVVDPYHAYGSMSLNAEKKLAEQLIDSEKLAGMVKNGKSLFSFTVQSADSSYDTANAPYTFSEAMTIDAATGKISWSKDNTFVHFDGEHFYVKPAADVDEVQLPDADLSADGYAVTMYFVLTEDALELPGVKVDPEEFHVAVTLTDLKDNGQLTTTYAWAKSDGSASGKINAGMSFVNTMEHGTLEISKEGAGNAPNKGQSFRFTVALSRTDDLSGVLAATKRFSYVKTDAAGKETKGQLVRQSNGTLTFELKADEKIVIGDILYGTTFEVTEKDYSKSIAGELDYTMSGYTTTVSLNDGEAAEALTTAGEVNAETADATVKFTNSRAAGKLTVSKSMTGTATTETVASGEHALDLTKQLYSFTVKLTNATVAPAGVYTVSAENMTADEAAAQGFLTDAEGNISIKVDANGIAKFQLRHDQSVTIENIVSGTAYEVSEGDERKTHGVTMSYDDAVTGTIISNDPEEQTEYATTVTNNRDAGTLSVTKETKGAAKDGQAFRMTVKLAYPTATDKEISAYAAKKTYSLTIGENTTYFTLNTSGEYSFELKNGETAIIGDVVYGTTFEVTEKDYSKSIAGELDYTMSGYTTTVSLNGADAKEALTTAGEVNAETADATVKFTNSRAAGKLTVSKSMTGTATTETVASGEHALDLTKQLYSFTVKLTNATVKPEGTYSVSAENMTADEAAAQGFLADAEGNISIKVDANGIAKFQLRHDQSVTIENIVSGTAYEVSEGDERKTHGVTMSYDDAVIGTIISNDPEEQTEYATTVTNNRDAGTLSVTKETKGAAKDDQAFRMTVKLAYPTATDKEISAYAAKKTYSLTIGENTTYFTLSTSGEYSFELKNGETAVIGDVVYGTTFEVTEKDYSKSIAGELDYTMSGYTTTVSLNDGEAAESLTTAGEVNAETADATVKFTNSRAAGKLTVSKSMTGTATTETVASGEHALDLTQQLYSFTVKLTNATVTPAGVYTVSTENMTADEAAAQGFLADAEGNISIKVDASGIAKFQLRHDQSVTIENIVSGTAYEVSEGDERKTHGVTMSYDDAVTGTIISNDPEEQTEFATTVTNNRDAGTLSVTKETKGAAKDGQAFRMTVKLAYPATTDKEISAYAAKKTYSLTIGENTTYFTLNTSGEYSFELKNGETAVIGDVVYGTTFEVTEKDYSKSIAGELDYTMSGYATTVSLNGADAKEALTTAGEVNAETADATVKFTNSRAAGKLTVSKSMTGTATTETVASGEHALDLTQQLYSFTVKLTNATVKPEGTYSVSAENMTADEAAAQGFLADAEGNISIKVDANGIAKFQLRHDQSVTIENIVSGTAYEVSEGDERKTHGVTMSYDDAVIGTIISNDPEEQTEYATTVTNNRDAGTLSVTKETKGAAKDGQAFRMTVKLAYPTATDKEISAYAAKKTYSLTIGENTTYFTLNTSGEYSFELKNGETAVIGDVVYGTTFEVTEKDYSKSIAGELDYTMSGYATTVSLNGADAKEALTTAGEVNAETADATVKFTNSRAAGKLTVSKSMTGTATTETVASGEHALDLTKQLYSFTVKLTNATVAPVGVYTVSAENMTADEAAAQGFLTDADGNISIKVDANGIAKFQLRHDQSVTIENIVSGTAYKVSEGDERKTHGVTMSYDDAVTGTIISNDPEEQTEYTTTVTNNRDAGTLSVTKELNGNAADHPVTDFAFSLKLVRTGDTLLDSYAAKKTYSMTIGEEVTYFTLSASDTYGFSLKGGETAVFGDILDGTAFTVSETNYEKQGFTTTAASDTAEISEDQTATGVIDVSSDATADQLVTFTNTRYTEVLTIAKESAGNAANDEQSFRFTVVLSHDKAAVDLTYPATLVDADGQTETEVTFTATTTNHRTAKAQIELLPGQKLMIDDVMTGTQYTVTEDNYRNTNTKRGIAESGYHTGAERLTISEDGEETTGSWTWNDTEIRIASGKLERSDEIKNLGETVIFTNTRLAGQLAITKQLTGTAVLDEEEAFTITVTLSRTDGIDPVGTYQTLLYTADEEEPTVGSLSLTGKGGTVKAVTQICKDQRLVILDILDGTAWTVTENDYRKQDGITTTVNGEDSWTAAGTMESTGEEQTIDLVEVVNNRDAGTLKVTKTVTGDTADPEKEFEFTVTLTHEDAELNAYLAGHVYTLHKTLPDGTTEDKNFKLNSAHEHTFTLKHGATAEILDVLYGTAWSVSEADYNVDGYIPTPEERVLEGVLEEAENTADFVNDRPTGSLTIRKVVEGREEPDRRFNFTITLKNPNGMRVVGDYFTSTGATVTFTGKGDGTLAKAVVSLKAGASLTIDGILVGTEVSVTEDDYAEYGYETEYAGQYGTMTEKGMQTTVTNTRNLGVLTISKKVVVEGELEISPDTVYSFAVKLKVPGGKSFTGVLPAYDGNGTTSMVTFNRGTAVIHLKDGENLTIDQIPAGSTYTVTEASIRGVTVTAEGDRGVVTTDGAAASFLNTYTQEYISLTVTKLWDDNLDANHMRPDSITVAVSTQEGAYSTVTLSEGNEWTATLTELPRFRADGSAYIYYVVENNVPEGYECSYERTGNTVYIYNTMTEPLPEDSYIIIGDLPVPAGIAMNMSEGDCFD